MKFEDLSSWQIARECVKEVYSLTRNKPLDADFGLKDQIQRASVSSMTNLAEGFERSGKQEKLHFYNMARASTGEVRSLLYVVSDVYTTLSDQAFEVQKTTERVGKLITGLIRSTQ